MKILQFFFLALAVLLMTGITNAQQQNLSSGTLEAMEGFVDVDGGEVWYQIIGSGDAIPLLVIHGGPGFPHDYLEPLARISDERPVIFYDQLGCGKSTRSKDTTLWTLKHYVREVARIREALKLDSLHILAHSWGSMVAVEYMQAKPAGVVSLILASPYLNSQRWMEDQKKYLAELPDSIRQIIEKNEKAGTTDSEEYQDAMMAYYHRHLCRLNPWPECMFRSLEGMGNNLYGYMWGPSEFLCTGTLKDYDRTGSLKKITVPALFTCGNYDEARPETVKSFQSLLPGSEMVLFEFSSHAPHLEETNSYLKTVRDFLGRVEETLKVTE